MSMAYVRCFLTILLLVTAADSRKDSKPAKKAMAPPPELVVKANTVASAPDCYLRHFAGRTPPTDFDYNDPAGGLYYVCQPAELPGQGPSQASSQVDHYATLFNASSGIAVFSAYVVTGADVKTIKSNQRCAIGDPWRETPGIQGKQGSTGLYSGSSKQKIDKGHLNPCLINGFSPERMLATFWYTNAVPQFGSAFNRASWKRYEGKIKDFVEASCQGNMHLITGTSKYGVNVNTLAPDREGPDAQLVTKYFPIENDPSGIVRPNSMWTAGCCIVGNGVAWSIAVMGNNRPEKDIAESRPMSVFQLEKLLVAEGAVQANLFPAFQDCRDETKTATGWIELQRTVSAVQGL